MERWFLPAELVRGILYGVALFPLRRALLDTGRLGGIVIAALLLLVGCLAGISGEIEDWV